MRLVRHHDLVLNIVTIIRSCYIVFEHRIMLFDLLRSSVCCKYSGLHSQGDNIFPPVARVLNRTKPSVNMGVCG